MFDRGSEYCRTDFPDSSDLRLIVLTESQGYHTISMLVRNILEFSRLGWSGTPHMAKPSNMSFSQPLHLSYIEAKATAL